MLLKVVVYGQVFGTYVLFPFSAMTNVSGKFISKLGWQKR
jgi:hypothetical protein